jgi:peptidoglycan/xylan/chitin deacetylase (PgdA/CDA1 family)
VTIEPVRPRLAAFAALLAFAGGMTAAVLVATGSSGGDGGTTPTSASRPAAHKKQTPKRRLVQGPHNSPVPILMYHVLGNPPPGTVYPELWVRPADLAGQMTWLQQHGYHVVTLRQVFRYWRDRVALPPKPVVATFDDGYLSDFTVAMPTLRRHGWAGVLNLVVENIKPGDISAWQVRRLIKAGWEIDAHTLTHADLTTLDGSALQHEVAGSRAVIRKRFAQPVDFFCYPAGRYNTSVVAAVRAAGYLGATTENPGVARPWQAYTLNRIRVNFSDGVGGFARKLTQATR